MTDLPDNDFICMDTIKPRKIKPQNIVCRILSRERGILSKERGGIIREFYKNIYPNLTIINVEKPAGFLRKFSPDGKYLIAFTYDQTSLEIYRFQGTGAAAVLLNGWESEVVPNGNTHKPYAIRSQIFNCLFQLKFVVNVDDLGKQLNRECSLFTNDSRFVIVGAASPITDDRRPNFFEIYTTNEMITPTLRCGIEDYSLYMIDLHNGRVTDQIKFKSDKIFLSHNQGLYLYNNTLAILSVQHQTIYIYELFDGTFLKIFKIGRFCSEEEEMLYNSLYSITSQTPFREATINSLKHRFLVFLYKRAKQKDESTGDRYYIRKFFKFFDQYNRLRMWKMQLLDDNHLLIKYAFEEVVMLKTNEPNSQLAYFVIYSIWDSKILAVYDNTSEEFLEIFENYNDMFRNARMNSDTLSNCSPNTNIYAKLLQQRFKQTIVSARGGGMVEATKRILAQLPISAQSYSSSPYLDLSLFSYDDKWVSVMERPKGCSEYPIRFFARDSGLLKFRIYPGLQEKTTSQTSKRLVAYTFHPTEPFAISVQRIDNDYVVNFHIRNARSESEA
ncbi:DET1 like [Pseudolycoriella hygida]|uniref:DET1 like n=1 Tax=Pseudolycoriella hygida TaxID=35572 RepID=A0A9Q0MJB3_9DIPT|nr:DET1 like [Pseudolycoriella hygida]